VNVVSTIGTIDTLVLVEFFMTETKIKSQFNELKFDTLQKRSKFEKMLNSPPHF